MKEHLPTESLPQNEYPHYFSLFQAKPVLLSNVFKESVPLGHAVRRLISSDLAIGIKVRTTSGKKDILVRMR